MPSSTKARHTTNCHRPRKRAIQYSRDVGDEERPRSTGYLALAEYDGSLRSGEALYTLIQRPLAVGTVERKCRHVDLEPFTALAHHLVAAGHEAGRRRKWDAAGIFEALARREHGLLADHAFAADFLLAARRIGNDPVPRPQLHRLLARVGDDDRVGPEILISFDRRAFRQEVRFDGDLDQAGNGAVHAGYSFEILEHLSEKLSRNQIA